MPYIELRAVADQLPSGLAVFGADRACSYANPAAVELLGRDPLGADLDELAEAAGPKLRVDTPPAGDGWVLTLHDRSDELERESEFRLLAENSADMVFRMD